MANQSPLFKSVMDHTPVRNDWLIDLIVIASKKQKIAIEIKK